MRIGIYGGSFDPPHLAHLILAQEALEQLALDEVVFVPAFRSPFKLESTPVSAEDRCEMVSLAISEQKRFRMEPFEALRQDVSYSCETIRHFSATFPTAQLVLLMGADAFRDFPQWREPDVIVSHASLGVACRPGVNIDLDTHPHGPSARVFRMPLLDISSSDIRARVREGRDIRWLVPWAVKVFIEARGLYRRSEL